MAAVGAIWLFLAASGLFERWSPRPLSAVAWTALVDDVGRWWPADHTWWGDGDALSIEPRAGGCFCETLDDGGGIEHMRVTFLQPGERVVLTGSLGPLLYEATAGVMDVKVEPIAGGSRLTMNYRAAGFAKGGAGAMAPLVDQVLATQMKRLRTCAKQRRCTSPSSRCLPPGTLW